MANYNTYPTKGIDFKIKLAQDALSNYLGIDNIDFYGRVQKTLSKNLKTFIPEVYYDFPQKKEVYYDDKAAKNGNVFFIVEEKAQSKNANLFTAKVKIVFMLDLKNIYPDKDYFADSEIQEYCYTIIKKVNCFSSKNEIEFERGVDVVLKGFDTSGIKLSDTAPKIVFSFNGLMSYYL